MFKVDFFELNEVLDFEFDSSNQEIITTFDDVQQVTIIEEKKENYKGEYEVTPKAFENIILGTKDKIMEKDLTIKEIPYFETSNEMGGNTVYIAKEV